MATSLALPTALHPSGAMRRARQANHESRQHRDPGGERPRRRRGGISGRQLPNRLSRHRRHPHVVRPCHHDLHPEWNSLRERHGRLLPHDRLGRRARERDLTSASSACRNTSGWNDVQIVNAAFDTAVPITCCAFQIDPHPPLLPLQPSVTREGPIEAVRGVTHGGWTALHAEVGWQRCWSALPTRVQVHPHSRADSLWKLCRARRQGLGRQASTLVQRPAAASISGTSVPPCFSTFRRSRRSVFSTVRSMGIGPRGRPCSSRSSGFAS